ncbi:hypothetical protein RQP46_004467 [Phenoliferia psychrophenolica]
MNPHPSSDDIEIVTAPPAKYTSHSAPSRGASSNALNFPSGSGNALGGSSSSSQAPLSRKLSNVIEIDSDDSSDDEPIVVVPTGGSSRAGSMTRVASAPIGSPSSDDIPDWRLDSRAPAGGAQSNAAARSTALNSTTNKIAGPALVRKPTALDKGKGKALVPSSDDAEDPWDTMDARGAQTTRRKRPPGNDSDGDDDNGKKAKQPAKKKAPRLSQDDKDDKKARAAAEKQVKLDQKATEAEAKKKLLKANNVQKDRKQIVVEVTAHVAGTAFRSRGAGEGENDESLSAAERKKLVAKRKEADWAEVSDGLKERLEEHQSKLKYDGAGHDYNCVGSVRWTRECTKKWNDATSSYLPLDGPAIIVEEDSRLLFFPASDILELINGKKLLSHIIFLKSRLPPGINLFLMICGVDALRRKALVLESAEYRNTVRAGLNSGEASVPANIGDSRKLMEKIELELMRVQVRTKVFIVKVEKPAEAVDWIEQFTLDVGLKPYQRLKNMHIGLLGMSDDKIQSGKDHLDTMIKMIHTIKNVTESHGKGVVASYPTLRNLYESWEDAADPKGMLVGIHRGHNLNGAATNRQIGAITSATVHRIFTSLNPDEFISGS